MGDDFIRDDLDVDREKNLLSAIAALDVGTIANVMQAAAEYNDRDDLSLYERLSQAYYELTNQDPAALDAVIGLSVSEDEVNEARAIHYNLHSRHYPMEDCAVDVCLTMTRRLKEGE